MTAITATASDTRSGSGSGAEGSLTPLRGPATDLAGRVNRFGRRRLGEIMVALGHLSARDRDRVLIRQPALRLPFGECAARMRLIDRDQLQQALACQFGFPLAVSGQDRISRDLVMLRDPFGDYGQALRMASLRLMTRCATLGCGALAVTGPGRREGRSHLAANLAVACAQAGHRVLLIDADLRNPRQHEIFGVGRHPGLSRLLCGYAPEDAAHRLPGLRSLTLVTAGPPAPNPLELLGSGALAALVAHARERHDLIVLDTPASSRWPDAELIACAAGGALLVVEENRSRTRAVAALRERLSANGVVVAGALVSGR